jgi:FkbH-like protein
MYEPEFSGATEPIDALPPEVRAHFAEYRALVTGRTTLPWGEHCTECVWPVCYTTCALYERRADGACRQFMGPVVRLDNQGGLNPYILKIRFKQWAKLWSVGTLGLKSLAAAEQAEKIHIALGALARSVPLGGPAKERILGKLNYKRREDAERHAALVDSPDAFVLECFNPEDREVAVTVVVRSKDREKQQRFEERIRLPQGYTRGRIAFSDIERFVSMSEPFEVEVVPNGCENATLYFGLMDFVKERAVVDARVAPGAIDRKFKCIVWDLDGTLWDGVLVEDGPKLIRLREEVVDAIKALDERGILHSIASKNNREDSLQLLREHGLEEYFLFPQIDWNPKSDSIQRIAQSLNIGLDAIAFVDDQVFEREEVKKALADVTVIDAEEGSLIPSRPECQVPLTSEGKGRRASYRAQEKRTAELKSFSGDYFGFLRDCKLKASLEPLTDGNLRRVYELAQRTNQMNFSGSRYHENELHQIMHSPHLRGFVIHCADRFGDYGIIGFAVVDEMRPCLVDLMFSCRVQAKRVEHAVLAFLLRGYVGINKKDFYANYRKTARNAPSGRVFEEIGFEVLEERPGMTMLIFRGNRAIPDDGIVRILTAQVEAPDVECKFVDPGTESLMEDVSQPVLKEIAATQAAESDHLVHVR